MLKFQRSAENWEDLFSSWEKKFKTFKNNMHTEEKKNSARKLRKLVIFFYCVEVIFEKMKINSEKKWW